MTPDKTVPKSSGVIRLQKLSKGKLSQARALRKEMTKAETALWEELRKKKVFGIKFRRQQIIEGFIVDFFCEKMKLVIEVDGSVHGTPEQKERDAHRRDVFHSRGLQELRFANSQIFDNMDYVIQEIKKHVPG